MTILGCQKRRSTRASWSMYSDPQRSYLQEHPELHGLEWRIDVIAIQGRPGEKVEDVHIEHFENISA